MVLLLQKTKIRKRKTQKMDDKEKKELVSQEEQIRILEDQKNSWEKGNTDDCAGKKNKKTHKNNEALSATPGAPGAADGSGPLFIQCMLKINVREQHPSRRLLLLSPFNINSPACCSPLAISPIAQVQRHRGQFWSRDQNNPTLE